MSEISIAWIDLESEKEDGCVEEMEKVGVKEDKADKVLISSVAITSQHMHLCIMHKCIQSIHSFHSTLEGIKHQ